MKKLNSIQSISNTMIKAALTLSVFILLFVGTNAQGTKRELSSFSKIEISGAYNVFLVQGTDESVLIDAEEKTISKIITKVEGGILKIYNENKTYINGDVDITINFKSINEIGSSGAIKLESKTPLNMAKLELEFSGATSSNLELNTESLEIEMSGSGKASLKGNSKSTDFSISGTGNIHAENLKSENCEIEISGVGNASVNVSNNLEVAISGTGSVSYSGEPKIKQEISGMGSLKKL